MTRTQCKVLSQNPNCSNGKDFNQNKVVAQQLSELFSDTTIEGKKRNFIKAKYICKPKLNRRMLSETYYLTLKVLEWSAVFKR